MAVPDPVSTAVVVGVVDVVLVLVFVVVVGAVVLVVGAVTMSAIWGSVRRI